MAKKGLRVLVYDLNQAAMNQLKEGEMPFFEEDAGPLLKEVIAEKRLAFTNQVSDVEGVPYLIVTIGTPVDQYQNPMLDVIIRCIDTLLPYLSDEQTLVLRSTLFPGVTDYLHKYLLGRGKKTKIAFCPERVMQGFAIKEVQNLPQLISGTTPEAEEAAVDLFSRICSKLVRLAPMEAEFAKLFCNAYRYIQFAAANQFFMMTQNAGVDYYRVLSALKDNYPRMRDMPGAGFAAGPCLLKDTMQLAAFANHEFSLGSSAVLVNEGLPLYLIDHLSSRYNLATMTVGLLGMAFKAESDDTRASLSYKLKKVLCFRAQQVLTTDPWVKTDPELLPLNSVIDKSDLLILCTPHQAYKNLDMHGKPVIDIWNFRPARTLSEKVC
jgi:UDP-N-acetyl-D-mannosaminuronic acid dehydrogenase